MNLFDEITLPKTNIHFSSASDDWATPKAFFDKLNKTFNFDLDPCASHQNAKCPKYFTQEDNGLLQNWEGKVFMNPPYGRSIGKWVKKAYEHNGLVVCLLPARTDTKYWHDYVMKADCIHYVKGRLKFNDGKDPAPFPSAVVIFNLFR